MRRKPSNTNLDPQTWLENPPFKIWTAATSFRSDNQKWKWPVSHCKIWFGLLQFRLLFSELWPLVLVVLITNNRRDLKMWRRCYTDGERRTSSGTIRRVGKYDNETRREPVQLKVKQPFRGNVRVTGELEGMLMFGNHAWSLMESQLTVSFFMLVFATETKLVSI